jgi:hypothetical protein
MSELEWFDSYNLIHDKPQPRASENAAVYTVLYHTLWELCMFNHVMANVSTALFSDHALINPSNSLSYRQAPWLNIRASHDNATGLISIASAYHDLVDKGSQWHKIRILPDYLHPRDIIYYGYVQRKWWSYPLLPVLFCILLITVMTRYKTRPGLIDWIKSGFKAERRKMLKSDTEILMWMRFRLLSHRKCISLMAKVLEPMMNRRFHLQSKHPVYIMDLVDIYFKQDDPSTLHPLQELAREYAFRCNYRRVF